MDVSVLARLGLREVSTILPGALYLTTGIDFTRPTEIQVNITHRCNYQCLQCACWRFEKIPEIGIDQWKKAWLFRCSGRLFLKIHRKSLDLSGLRPVNRIASFLP